MCTILGTFRAPQLFELGLEPLVHGYVYVAIHLDEARQQQERSLDALDQRQRWLWLRAGPSLHHREEHAPLFTPARAPEHAAMPFGGQCSPSAYVPQHLET